LNPGASFNRGHPQSSFEKPLHFFLRRPTLRPDFRSNEPLPMSWYYAENNERRGPIEDAAFDGLVAAGAVRPETLVWREGMTNWQALSSSGYARPGAPLPPNSPPALGGAGEDGAARPPGVEMGVCSESGRILPRSELVEIDGRLVSAEYKNVVLQRIREGVGSSGSSIDPEVLAQQIIARDYQLSVGSCLSRGWQVMKSHFWLCVGASFLSTLVVYASLLTLIGIFFVFGPLTAGLYWMMLRMHRNEPASIGDAFAGFSRNFWHLVGVGLFMILAMLACFVPVGICFGVAFAASPKNPSIPILGLAGLLAFVAYGAIIYLAVSWVFSFILVIDKQIEAWPAMKLSRRIVSMHWWRVFGVLFVTGLLIFGIMFSVMIVGPLLANLIVGAHPGSGVAAVVAACFSLLGSCISLCLTPLMYATIAVAYEDIFGSQVSRQ
jgi:hypothetical protein